MFFFQVSVLALLILFLTSLLALVACALYLLSFFAFFLRFFLVFLASIISLFHQGTGVWLFVFLSGIAWLAACISLSVKLLLKVSILLLIIDELIVFAHKELNFSSSQLCQSSRYCVYVCFLFFFF